MEKGIKKSPLLPIRRDELCRVTTLIHIRFTPHISAASINAYLCNGRTRERLIRFHRSGSGTSYHKFRIPSCTHRRLSEMSGLCFCSCQRLYHIDFIIPILPAFVNRTFADLTICSYLILNRCVLFLRTLNVGDGAPDVPIPCS